MKLHFLLKTFLFTAILGGFSQLAIAQGSTTGTIRGLITDGSNEAIIGANVTAVHEPTQTFYGSASDLNGNYQINNVKIGGPYTVTVSYTGYQSQVYDNVFVRLGEAVKLSTQLSEGSIDLVAIVVTAKSGTAGENSGASTQISAEDLANMPTLNRDLNDFTRLTPQAKGSFGGGFSIAGTNNRYNAIYIDGAVNNDVFGLAANGTNGGQTGIAPISIDAIDQVQVVISPYDVTLGGFAGGGISAVTKSGSNEFKGTAYYFMQNENFAGKTNSVLVDRTGSEASKLDAFDNTLWGASLGGPIVKDKVFFFVNAEIENRETPTAYDLGIYRGNSNATKLDQLRDFVTNTYGYDPGEFGSIVEKLDGVRLFGKVDFNINKTNKLTLRHQYTKAEQLDLNVSGSGSINFSNNGYTFPSTTNSTALELNSQIGSNFSNNLIVGFTSVLDDRDPIGVDFPYVSIVDGDNGTIFFGTEQFSTANQLDQKIFTVTDNFKMYKGNHTVTLGTHNEFFSIYNLFIRQNFGSYRFASVDDFIAGNPAIEYDRSFSLVDDITGDGSAAAADFSAMQLGIYAQDEWTLNRQLTLTAGVRLDVPIITTDPAGDANFQATLDEISKFYDLEGAKAGQAPSGQLMFSPRVGFNYSIVPATKTTLRGGVGIFTSRVPFVWPGGMFTNNGITIGGVNETNINGDIVFIADPNRQYTNPDFKTPSGQLDLFTEDFKYPQVLRGNLALDHSFEGDIKVTVEGIFTKTLNNVDYLNVNSDPTVDFNWTNNGGDTRPVYTRTNIDPSYTAIYLGRNTNKGSSYNVSASVAKKFDFGLDASVSYAYGDARAVNEGTSSQNSSQWRGSFMTDGRNNAILGRSDFALGHRVIGSLNYGIDWNKAKNASTSITIFYQGQSGDPYSYVYGGNAARNINNEQGSTSQNTSLIWIPANESEINLVDITDSDGAVISSAAAQWTALNDFIESDKYLSQNRGAYAEKNGARSPFSNQLDLRITQSIGTLIGGKSNRLQISVDVFNFMNLINPSWGAVYSNPFAYQLINLQGYAADGTTPTFTFNDERRDLERFNLNDLNSRWRMRLGLRYIFN